MSHSMRNNHDYPSMELLAPAGSLEKMETAYAFGADAVYAGVPGLSLRAGAERWSDAEIQELMAIRTKWSADRSRRLYLALNRYIHQGDIDVLDRIADSLGTNPADAFIVSDLGMVSVLRSRFPDVELHLSTQANCTNSEAARIYRDLGFSRIVAARELSLDEIANMHARIPEMEIEIFVHGAVCIAYSGRCLISSWLTGRSANHGACTHSCRWQYREFEERKRPGEPLRIEEGDGYSTIFSPEDMCLIDFIRQVEEAGVSSIKIEGRMKSAYYLAAATQAYRLQLDALRDPDMREAADSARDELFLLPHRGYSTGMYFGQPQVFAEKSEKSPRYLGIVQNSIQPEIYPVYVKNKIQLDDGVAALVPGTPAPISLHATLLDENLHTTDELVHGKKGYIRTKQQLAPYSLLRNVHMA